jgi:hypothetical protein
MDGKLECVSFKKVNGVPSDLVYTHQLVDRHNKCAPKQHTPAGQYFVSHPLPKSRGKNTTKIWKGWRCSMCKQNATPERRTGPAGFKSLCNACGLKHKRIENEKRVLANRANRDTRERMSVQTIINEVDVAVETPLGYM